MSKTNNEKYAIALLEIARHEEDANYNRLAHFAIAKRYRKLYTRFFWTQTISIAIILTLLLSPLDKIIAEPIVNVIKILLSLIIAILSSLGAIYNLNEIANHHHLIAHKYQTLWRHCKNCITDFPDEAMADEAIRTAKIYRDRINEINRDSPQIPDWAHDRVKVYMTEGMDKFDIEAEQDLVLSPITKSLLKRFGTTKDKKAIYEDALKTLCERIANNNISWAITGSFGLALQEVPVDFNDIDILTTKDGAYQIEHCCPDFVTRKVQFTSASDIRSHYGILEIKGIKIDLMGAVENNFNDPNEWIPRTDWEEQKHLIEIMNLKVPVLNLNYEYTIYSKLKRSDIAKIVKDEIDRKL